VGGRKTAAHERRIAMDLTAMERRAPTEHSTKQWRTNREGQPTLLR
jgi:hypothetical protein